MISNYMATYLHRQTRKWVSSFNKFDIFVPWHWRVSLMLPSRRPLERFSFTRWYRKLYLTVAKRWTAFLCQLRNDAQFVLFHGEIQEKYMYCLSFVYPRKVCLYYHFRYLFWGASQSEVSSELSLFIYMSSTKKFQICAASPRENWISNIWWVCVIFKYVWKHFQWKTIKELTFVCGKYFDSKRKANPFACLDHTLSCSEHIFLIGDGFDPFDV